MPTARESERVARTVAEQVRDARKGAGLRQEELALAAGVSTRTLHSIEHGGEGVRMDKLLQVLEALGLTLEVVPRPRRLAVPPPLHGDDE